MYSNSNDNMMDSSIPSLQELENELNLLRRERAISEHKVKEIEIKEKKIKASNESRPALKRERDRDFFPMDSAPSKRSRLESSTNQNEKPKITSAIISHSGKEISANSEKERVDNISKKRDAKIFGSLVSHLKQFKTELDKKSESIIKREEVEQKVTEKVMKERESFTEQQKKELQEKKERELALCDEIRSKHEAKELQYLNLKWQQHQNQLSAFFKTTTKPPIYYRYAIKITETKSSIDEGKHEEQTTSN